MVVGSSVEGFMGSDVEGTRAVVDSEAVNVDDDGEESIRATDGSDWVKRSATQDEMSSSGSR